ncbi:MAG: S-adenosyl-L-homocysteine hydrolase [Pseudomonadota bacterium]
MKYPELVAAACVLATTLTAGTTPVAPQNDAAATSASSIRKLDIMLMVTSLRCRGSAHDFQSDYHAFAAKHLKHLNRASAELRQSLVAKHGAKGSKRALDRIGVSMANTYGDGHPWMGCAELKQVTRELSDAPDSARLYEAARELLAPKPATAPMIAQAEPAAKASPRSVRLPYDWPGSRQMAASQDR